MNLKKLFLKHCEVQQYEINENQLDIINYLKIYYTKNFAQSFLTKIFKTKKKNLAFILLVMLVLEKQ